MSSPSSAGQHVSWKVYENGHAVGDKTGSCGWRSGVVVDRWRRSRVRRSSGSGHQHNLQLPAGVAALNAQSSAAATQFNASPAAQAWVRTFLARRWISARRWPSRSRAFQGLSSTLD
jgi:hypothetical protein